MLHETSQEKERAFLVAVDTGDYDIDASLDELEQLAKTADIEVVGRLTQNRSNPDVATFLGGGKLKELRDFIEEQEVDLVIFDDELSPTQLRNIEKTTEIAVYDRTMLILEIFAQSAHTAEGRLQVDLAHHKYLLPRLAGMGVTMSRLAGGGAGGGGARRGKGETKLELDRRHIRRHIQNLEKELDALVQRRERFRERRQKDGVTTVAIVGYTNVGKSTLLNALTDAGVLVEDKLFATLDPTSRGLDLPDGRRVVLVDTVGLVRRLPHHLVNAFKSTLEESLFADLILLVSDSSSPDLMEQIQVTTDMLIELGVEDTPVLHVLNKADLTKNIPLLPGEHTVVISAAQGFGLGALLEKISQLLPETQTKLQLLIPYEEGQLLDEIRKEGLVLEEEFQSDGVHLTAMVDHKILHLVKNYIQTE